MSYTESRRPWRKLWRKEPARRQAELSYRARTLLPFLLGHADDAGCLGPVSEPGPSERGHPAATLAQALAIGGNRRTFYGAVDDLLAYGDDGEPLALVKRGGHFFLTRFEECQAVRRRRDKTPPQPGQNADTTRTEHGPSLPPNPAQPFESETELGAEVRSKKREERNSINGEAKKEGGRKANDSDAANRPAGREPGSLAKSMYAEHYRKRYGKERTNLERYRQDFERIEELAAQQPGPRKTALAYVLDSFFADDSQVVYGSHSPGTLAKNGFYRHVKGYAEEHKAERRNQAEREHSEKVFAKLEADKAQRLRERAEEGWN